MNTLICPVNDLDTAKAVWSALLGVAPSVDEPYYVHFDTPIVQVGLNPNGHAEGMTGPVAYWTVDDLDATMAAIEAAGGSRHQEPRQVGGGRTVAVMTDADGNQIGLMHDRPQA